MVKCYCCSGQEFAHCCEPFLIRSKIPQTPEQLMRSRYTAYVLADMLYIKETMKGTALADFNEEESKAWANHVEWLGLQVLTSSNPSKNDHEGIVEFIAVTKNCNEIETIREVSKFRKENGKWYYIGQINHKQSKNKIGRNDLCPCGSERKFKKCCGRNG